MMTSILPGTTYFEQSLFMYIAPSGCLQYFTKSSGIVKILGYPENPHLAGLQYTICVRKELGAESIFVRTTLFQRNMKVAAIGLLGDN